MKKIIYLLFIVFSLLSCNSNNTDDTEKEGIPGVDYPKSEYFDGGSITYKFNEGVIVIDKTNEAFLQKVESDTILYFSKSSSDKLNLTVGTIINSSIISDLTPYGLGNKILSITEEGDYIRCVSTRAPLDEIFEVLNINADFQLFCDTISQTLVDVDGDTVSVMANNETDLTRFSIGSPKAITINLGNKSSSSRIGPYATGSMSLGAVGTIDIDLGKHQYECSLALYAGFEGELGTQATWSGYKKLLPKSGKWTIALGVFEIGPVILVPLIDAELGVQAKIEGTASTTISKRFGGKFGLRNGQSFYENLTNSNTDIIKNISVDAKGGIGLVTKLGLALGIYSKDVTVAVRPSISAGFSTDFKLNNENLFKNHPNLDFKITADADISFEAKILSIQFAHAHAAIASFELFSYRKIIYYNN